MLLLGIALVACAPGAPAPAAPSGSAAGTTAAPKPGGNVTYALARDIAGKWLDPNVVNGGQPDIVIWTQVYDTLLYQDDEQRLQPGLAASWDISEDGKLYTFHLRQDVRFHDGTPFTAEAVKFTFDRIMQPGNPSTARQHFTEVQSTEVVDDYTVRVTLRNAQPIFLLRLTRPYNVIVSPAAVRALGPEGFGQKPVGTGPFVLQEWVPGERFVLRRNPDYAWGPPFFKHAGAAYLDSVTFRVIPEASVRVAALESGEVDAIEFVPPQELERLQGNPSYRVQAAKRAGAPTMLYLNTQLAPTNELAVRRALTLATDRETINQTAYLGAQFASYGFMQPQMYAYAADLEPQLRTNVDEAKRLLDEAGWRVGSDGVRAKDGRPLELRGVFTGSPSLPFELLQAQWRAVGAKLNLQVLNKAGHDEAAQRGQGNVFAVAVSGYTSEDPDLLRLVYSCEAIGLRNFAHYCDEGFDHLATEAYLTPFSQKRVDLYHQLQEKLIADAVSVPFIGENVYIASKASVRDLWTNNLGLYPVFVDAWVDR
jgi:peptide/nickel transport system substrate-binding protein